MTKSVDKRRFEEEITEDEIMFLRRETQLFNPRLDDEEMRCCLKALLKYMMDAAMVGVTEKRRKLLKNVLFVRRQAIIDSKMNAEEMIIKYLQACVCACETVAREWKQERNADALQHSFESIEPIDYFTYSGSSAKLKRRLMEISPDINREYSELRGEKKRIRPLLETRNPGVMFESVQEPSENLREKNALLEKPRAEILPLLADADSRFMGNQSSSPYLTGNDVGKDNTLMRERNRYSHANSRSLFRLPPKDERNVVFVKPFAERCYEPDRRKNAYTSRGEDFTENYSTSRDGYYIPESSFGAFGRTHADDHNSRTERTQPLYAKSYKQHSSRFDADALFSRREFF